MRKDVLESIISAGPSGIKKVELEKTFGKDCKKILESLVKDQLVFMEKKKNAYFVWSKDGYVAYLSDNDPKCKIILDSVTNRESEIKKEINLENGKFTPSKESEDQNTIFKTEFDKCLKESSISIGWAPFNLIRKRICELQNISDKHFYMLASDLVEKHRENYEVSSGGQEGILMRGLIHGFVRCV